MASGLQQPYLGSVIWVWIGKICIEKEPFKKEIQVLQKNQFLWHPCTLCALQSSLSPVSQKTAVKYVIKLWSKSDPMLLLPSCQCLKVL